MRPYAVEGCRARGDCGLGVAKEYQTQLEEQTAITRKITDTGTGVNLVMTGVSTAWDRRSSMEWSDAKIMASVSYQSTRPDTARPLKAMYTDSRIDIWRTNEKDNGSPMLRTQKHN
jgi:hypothetical protein